MALEGIKFAISIMILIPMLKLDTNGVVVMASIMLFSCSGIADFINIFDKRVEKTYYTILCNVIGLIVSVFLFLIAIGGLTNNIDFLIQPNGDHSNIFIRSSEASILSYKYNINNLLVICYITPAVIHIILLIRLCILYFKRSKYSLTNGLELK